MRRGGTREPFGEDVEATEAIGEEVVRTLATSIGLVLAVPVTTAIAAVVASRARTSGDLDGSVAEAEDEAVEAEGGKARGVVAD